MKINFIRSWAPRCSCCSWWRWQTGWTVDLTRDSFLCSSVWQFSQLDSRSELTLVSLPWGLNMMALVCWWLVRWCLVLVWWCLVFVWWCLGFFVVGVGLFQWYLKHHEYNQINVELQGVTVLFARRRVLFLPNIFGISFYVHHQRQSDQRINRVLQFYFQR